MIRYGTELAEPKRVAAGTLSSLSDDQRIRLGQITGRILKRMQQRMTAIFETGEDLNRAKNILQHGEFLNWLEDEFGWTHRTAHRYMNAAKVFAGKYDIMSHLNPSTVYELAAPSTPETVRQKIVRRLEAGERFQPDDIKAMVDRAKIASAQKPAEVAPQASGVEVMEEPRQPASGDRAPAVIEGTADVLSADSPSQPGHTASGRSGMPPQEPLAPPHQPAAPRPEPTTAADQATARQLEASTPASALTGRTASQAPVTEVAARIRARRQARIVELIVDDLGDCKCRFKYPQKWRSKIPHFSVSVISRRFRSAFPFSVAFRAVSEQVAV